MGYTLIEDSSSWLDPSIFSDIQSMETYGEYGSKIQTLVRHLLYVKLTDAGAKSIVFSAWADSLHSVFSLFLSFFWKYPVTKCCPLSVVEWALKENGIRCLRIDQKSKNESAANVFRANPDILVLLLHGYVIGFSLFLLQRYTFFVT